MYSCYFRTKIFPLETNVNIVLPRIGVPVRIRSESTSKHALTYTPAALESRYDGFLHRSRRRKKSNVFCSLPDHNPRGLVSRSICSLPVSPNHVLAITRGSQDTSRIPLSSAIDWLLLTMMFLSNRSSYLLLFHVRIPLVENWRQRWNRSQPETRKPFSHFQLRHRHYQTRWHIFFLPFPRFYQYNARSSRRSTDHSRSSCLYSSIPPSPSFFFAMCPRIVKFEEIFDFRRIVSITSFDNSRKTTIKGEGKKWSEKKTGEISYERRFKSRNAYGLLYITEYRSRFICNLS